jgi:hypothetical protein
MHTLSTRTLSALAFDRGEDYDPAMAVCPRLLEDLARERGAGGAGRLGVRAGDARGVGGDDRRPGSCINGRAPGWPGRGNVRLSRENAGY